MSFLLYASGVSSQYLQESPESDNIKYKNIGFIIILTAFFSSLSMFYASYTSFLSAKIDTSNSLIYAICIAFSWSIFIFTIDRYFIISMTKSKNKLFEFFISIFRILLAGLIGFIISKPLIVAIFSDNIDKSLYSSYIKELEVLEGKFKRNKKLLNKNKNI